MPWGDLMNEAVVAVASAGKPVIAVMSFERRVRGRINVSQLTIRLAIKAKFEFLRNG